MNKFTETIDSILGVSFALFILFGVPVLVVRSCAHAGYLIKQCEPICAPHAVDHATETNCTCDSTLLRVTK